MKIKLNSVFVDDQEKVLKVTIAVLHDTCGNFSAWLTKVAERKA